MTVDADELETPPVVVSASGASDQLASGFRSLIVALGAYGVGKGWFDGELVAAVVPFLMIVGPIAWGQLKARAMHRRAVTMASALPDRLAVIK